MAPSPSPHSPPSRGIAEPCRDASCALFPILPTLSSDPAPPSPSEGIAGERAEPCGDAFSPTPPMLSSAPAPPSHPLLWRGVDQYADPFGESECQDASSVENPMRGYSVGAAATTATAGSTKRRAATDRLVKKRGASRENMPSGFILRAHSG